jgi:acyl-CoA synthetase (AMP-forming)/AMP-acid ligase II
METALSPLDFARRTRRLYPDREAVVDGELRLSYQQFFDRCDRWSAALQGLGVAQSDRVATIAPNTHAQLESFYAVPQIGGVLVPINYRLNPEDFIYIVNHCGATVVCAHGDYVKAVDRIRDQMPQVRHLVAFEDAADGWLDYEAAIAAADLRKVDPATIFALIRDEKVTRLCAAPTVLISLANAPAAMRGEVPAGVQVVTAGAPPAAATIERLEGEFGWEVTHVYGLTETAPFITVCVPLPEHRDLPPADRAVIKARQGVELLTSGELRVVDSDGQEVPADGQTVGEIVVRGNVVMQGYYLDPEATERAMGDGWFHTGNAAVVHLDGYVEIRDRLKDVIISGGENISSVEVEGTLLRHPAVQEAAIVGLPDEKWGETPHAFVVLHEDASASEEDIIAFARDNLAHFKAPRGVTFVSELPKTATGKIQKYVLRKGAPNLTAQ